MKITNYITKSIFIVILMGIIVVSNMIIEPKDISKMDENGCKINETDCIFPDENIFFHIDNATFNVTDNIMFHNITRTNDYMMFNDTKFYIDASNVDITLNYLLNDTTILGTQKLVSFYTDNFAWFNITGFLPDTSISIYINSSLFTTTISDSNGIINLCITNTSLSYIELYYHTASWTIISDTYNGIFTNISKWNIIDNVFNGIFTNTTIILWQTIDNTFNGLFINSTIISSWHNVDNTYNGIFSNATITSNITFSNIYPLNNAYGIPLQPTAYVTINHTYGETINISWYYGLTEGNETILLEKVENTINGTYMYSFYFASIYAYKYYWKIQATDGIEIVEEILNFKTTGMTSEMETAAPNRLFYLFSIFGIFGLVSFFVLKKKKKKR